MEDESLVEAVRRRCILYDVSCLSYRNNDKKEHVWQQIATDLNRESE